MFKILQKVKFDNGDARITKYKICGLTLLRKEKTSKKKKLNLLGIKFVKTKKNKRSTDISANINKPTFICQRIDIIIPVYNGYEYLSNLFESIKRNTDLPYRILVINDCSSDKRVKTFLEKQKSIFDNIKVLENRQNQGFLKSVNTLLKLAENDVAIINTDVILPKDWASRLMYPIFSDDKVASVTPFSNAATIFSLPQMGSDNIFNDNLEKINSILQKIEIDYTKFKFPTGVGFCMAMSLKALQSVGYFDEIFEKGYGEENDWCQRAIAKGFYNTIAPNLFVWHKHGGSFASNEKKILLNKHTQIINKRYKNYGKDVCNIFSNPDYKYLHFIAETLYLSTVAENVEVWFDHAWGGGTETYTMNQIEEIKKESLFIRVQQNKSNELTVSYFYKDLSGDTEFNNMRQFKRFLGYFSVSKIVVNNLASYQNISNTLLDIADLKRLTNAYVSFRGHDFQAICPTITMLKSNNTFCNCNNFKQCEKCLKNNKEKVPINYQSIDDYHFMWNRFLSEVVDEFLFFCESTRDIFIKYYPFIINKKIKIIPHRIKNLRKVKIKQHTGINIAVIGAINNAKGADIINKLGDYLADKKHFNIKVIGILYPIKGKNIKIFGKYKRDELPEILENEEIDIVFIPSIWPETFSYTTREAIEMGIPVCCFNMGGQAEQVKKYDKGLILEKQNVEYICKKIREFLKSLQ